MKLEDPVVDVDFSSEWIRFVNKLNHFHDQKEDYNLSIILDYLSVMISCQASYLIKVKEDKLDWSTYKVWGDKRLLLELSLTALHQEVIEKGQKICKDNYKLLPIYNHNKLVMIFGVYSDHEIDTTLYNHLEAMAEIGYQRLLKNQIIQQLRTSERVFRLTFEQAGSGMCQTTLDGKIKYANSKFYEMIAYTEKEAMGLRIKDLTYPEDWEKDQVLKQQLVNKEIPFFSMEKRYIKKDGSLTWVYITVSLMEGDALEEDILIGVIQDINSQKELEFYRKNQEKALENIVKERTQALVSVNKALIDAHKTKDLVIEELKEAKKALEIMAVEDPLTHLYNRRYMMDQLSKEAERFERYETPFTIIICDIDYFKSINDAYGHNCGDQILVSLSQVLKNALRKIDVLSRWGGEEYLILLPEVDLEAGIFVANRLREKIEKRVFQYLDEILHLTMTFGVASFKTGDTIETLIKNADDALYRGKNSNKNCVMS